MLNNEEAVNFLFVFRKVNRSLSWLDVFLVAELSSVRKARPVRAHNLTKFTEFVDPEGMAHKVEGAVSTLAGHKQVTAAKNRLVIEPVNVHAINCDCVILAINGNTLEPSLLSETHFVAQALVLVASLNDLNGIGINHPDINDVPVILV